MRKAFLIALLFISPVRAEVMTLSCFPINDQQHILIIRNESIASISWNNGPLNKATAEDDSEFLIITQRGDAGIFRLVYDLKSGEAYGGTQFKDGRDMRTYFKCTKKINENSDRYS